MKAKFSNDRFGFITMILLFTNVSKNSPNCTVGMIFSGDHDVFHRHAYSNQTLDASNQNADRSHIVLQQGILQWAKDTYDFVCQKWGEENVISFAVHCDETSIHAHVQTIPVEKVKKRRRIGSQYIHNDNPDIVLIITRSVASMVLLVAFPTTNCPKRRNEDGSTRIKWCLKPSDKRKLH